MKSYSLPLERDFEKCLDNLKSHLIILENNRGMEVALSDYGARIVSILVPDKNGHKVDVVLGFDHIEKYINAKEPYYGVTVGRFANRIANGQFEIDGKSYKIEPNNGPNLLHGGKLGFHNRIWSRRVNYKYQADFYLISPDGEGGFPGNLTVSVQYTLTDENKLMIRYRAHSDKNTIINLTNHAFFNLNGEGQESIHNHQVTIDADYYLPVNSVQIPTGEHRLCKGSVFDFSTLKSIDEQFDVLDEQVKEAGGFDHTFVLNNRKYKLARPVANVISPLTGIQLAVYTDQPGLQFYTGNALQGIDIGKSGKKYDKHAAFCLETQGFPDAPNQPDFPSCLLKAGEEFRSETQYQFRVVKNL